MLLELIEGIKEMPEDLLKSISALLKESKKLAEKRNIVAHSPLVMKVYEHPQHGWKYVDETLIGNLRNVNNAISFEKLESFTAQTEKLAEKLAEKLKKTVKIKDVNSKSKPEKDS